MIDLRPDHLDTVRRILAEHVPECEVRAFGSRAAWTAKDYSDLDLAVVSAGPLHWRTLGRLKEAFEESSLPMRVDVLDWHAIPDSFRQVIERGYVVVQEGTNRTVANEWRDVPFADLLVEPVRNGIYKRKEFHGRGVKVVNMGELFANPRLHDVYMRRVELSESERHRFSVQARDLLFARRSLVAEGAGKCSVVLEINELTAFESSIIRARPDPTKTDSLFLYYYFNSPIGLHALDSIRRQVAVAGITGTDLSQLSVRVPPLPEQRAIAHVLGTLDDKIELNRRMNETLEAMARALFKDWFVDFGPVRAKMAGREPYLPPDVWSLFPDRLAPSELGDIPAGWEIKTLGGFGKIITGKTPSTREPRFYGTDVPFLRIPDMHGRMYAVTTSSMLSNTGALSQPQQALPSGSISVSCIATPGLVILNHHQTHTNQQINSIVPYDLRVSKYLYWSSRRLASEIMLKGSGGSVFQNMNKSTFRALEILDARMDVITSFDAIVTPLHEKMLRNEEEGQHFSILRDTLLPKLMSRKIKTTWSKDQAKAIT